ncbi:trafficking protein Mon1-domain-containing protein [Abortiporus biennis]|nr:trafficking protein Mon1-domain-containing protein [Abortiporus biennis]
MSRTPRSPRSRTPSRVGTPIRLAPSAPSVSNLRVYSHGSTPGPSIAPTPVSGSPPSVLTTFGGSSSSSSTTNPESMEGILVQDPDAEVDTVDGEEGTATGRVENISDEEAKRNLRDHLRRTLSERDRPMDISQRAARKKGKAVDVDELQPSVTNLYPPRQYFVLTDAGKPVFISRQEDEGSDTFTATIGLMQALISVFLDDGDKIRCINAGKTRISFILRSPLYYACVSSWGEPESVILSVVSQEQLRRMFERRNFDLRRLLSGAEPFMHTLLARMEWDLAMSTSSLYCLKLEPGLRKSIADALVPTSKIKDILYVILIAQGRVVTLVRPKKHSIHPSDLHILINTIHSPSILNNSASASWLPICLPKFNSSAFVNAYVTFLRRNQPEAAPRKSSDETSSDSPEADSAEVEETSTSEGGGDGGEESETDTTVTNDNPSPEIGLVCVSGAADFEAVRGWCTTVSEKLEREGMMQAMVDAIHQGKTSYLVSDLSIPGLRHFLYKSRANVQVSMPEFEDPYDDLNEKRRLITLYQMLHDAIHAKSGQESTLKLQYIRTERESVMGWITQPFELYMALSPLIPKSAAVNAANSIARWVQKEEKRLFLRDAPVF